MNKITATLAIAFTISGSFAQAQTVYNIATSGNWTSNSTWSPGTGTPGTPGGNIADDISITGAGARSVTVDGAANTTFRFDNFTSNTGATIQFRGAVNGGNKILRIDGDFTKSGSGLTEFANQTSGSLLIQVEGDTFVNAGTLGLGILGGQLNRFWTKGNFTINNGGVVNVSTSTGSRWFEQGMTIASGGLFNGQGAIAGSNVLAAGLIDVSGKLAIRQGAVGSLSTNGSIRLNDGGTIAFDLLNTGSHDTLSAVSLDLTTMSLANLELNGLAGQSIALNDAFTLYTGSVSGFSAGKFNIVNNTAWTDGWSISSNGSNLVLTAVPEPSTAVLLGLGLAGVALLRRRRHKA